MTVQRSGTAITTVQMTSTACEPIPTSRSDGADARFLRARGPAARVGVSAALFGVEMDEVTVQPSFVACV
ncbi:hypothetical protein GCM10009692_11320 [Leucobacter aridicollis]